MSHAANNNAPSSAQRYSSLSHDRSGKNQKYQSVNVANPVRASLNVSANRKGSTLTFADEVDNQIQASASVAQISAARKANNQSVLLPKLKKNAGLQDGSTLFRAGDEKQANRSLSKAAGSQQKNVYGLALKASQNTAA